MYKQLIGAVTQCSCSGEDDWCLPVSTVAIQRGNSCRFLLFACCLIIWLPW